MSAPFGNVSPQFGRWWSMTVTAYKDDTKNVLTVDSSSEMRVVFDIYTFRWKSAFWYADFSIYNLERSLTDLLLSSAITPPRVDPTQVKPGVFVTFSAGYKNGAQGKIWEGPVFQQLWERENVVDFKLTLHCALGLLVYSNENAIAYDFGIVSSQTELVKRIADKSFAPIPTATIANLSKQKLPRGKVVFGNPAKYLDDIAAQNGMSWFVSQRGLEMARGDEGIDPNQPPELTYSPPPPSTYTPSAKSASQSKSNGIIIGTPQQTQDGVSFGTLLDPRLHVTPIQRVRIDNSSIKLAKLSFGQYPTILDENGDYFVQGLRHWGDTRPPGGGSGPWYSEVTGVTNAYFSKLTNFLGNG